MRKPELWVLLLFIVLIVYLSYSLLSTPPRSFSNLDNLLPNTYLTLSGTPENVRYYKDEVRFTVNGVQVRSQGIRILQNKTLIVDGYVSHYKELSWIQALKIKDAS